MFRCRWKQNNAEEAKEGKINFYHQLWHLKQQRRSEKKCCRKLSKQETSFSSSINGSAFSPFLFEQFNNNCQVKTSLHYVQRIEKED